jgi:hypothetical protein
MAAAADRIFLCVYVELAQVEKMVDGVDIVLQLIEVCCNHRLDATRRWIHPPAHALSDQRSATDHAHHRRSVLRARALGPPAAARADRRRDGARAQRQHAVRLI